MLKNSFFYFVNIINYLNIQHLRNSFIIGRLSSSFMPYLAFHNLRTKETIKQQVPMRFQQITTKCAECQHNQVFVKQFTHGKDDYIFFLHNFINNKTSIYKVKLMAILISYPTVHVQQPPYGSPVILSSSTYTIFVLLSSPLCDARQHALTTQKLLLFGNGL